MADSVERRTSENVPHYHIGDGLEQTAPSHGVPAGLGPASVQLLQTPRGRVPQFVLPRSPIWEASPARPATSARTTPRNFASDRPVTSARTTPRSFVSDVYAGLTPRELRTTPRGPKISARMQVEPRELLGLADTARHIKCPSSSSWHVDIGMPDLPGVLDPGLSVETHRLLAKAKTAREYSEQADVDEARLPDASDFGARYYRILLLSAAIASSMSFCVDEVAQVMGFLRKRMLETGDKGWILTCIFNMFACVCARLLIRYWECPEAEGSGMPEVKCMLFGQVKEVKKWLTVKVLMVKTSALALVVGGGLAIGKEGPFVHLASCITAILEPRLLQKDSKTAFPLLLASVAVGVGTTFSAPLGGVLFALELMLPQIYDKQTYLSCFQASVIGSVIFTLFRTWASFSTQGLLPLMDTDVLPGEGVPINNLALNIGVHVLLGVLCGALGGLWIKFHRRTQMSFKAWRLRGQAKPRIASTPKQRGPSAHFDASWTGVQRPGTGNWATENKPSRFQWVQRLRSRISCAPEFEWRDLFLVAMVALVNSKVTSLLPLFAGLEGEPPTQPALLSILFSKNLERDASTWDLGFGKEKTMMICFLVKWVMSACALSLPTPGGIVAPTMIIGGLLGRCYAYFLLPDWLVDLLLDPGNGSPVTAEDRGAFIARLSIVGAAAFCSSVARAFAMAITVFEVLALPNSVIPLSIASLTSIFVANRINVGFFDQILINKDLLGVSAIGGSNGTSTPAYRVMRRYASDLDSKCLPTKACLGDVQQLLHDTRELAGIRSAEEYFPIVQHCRGSAQPLIVGTISRKGVEEVLGNSRGDPRDTMVDFLDLSDFKEDARKQLVNRTPLHVDVSTAVQHVFLILKVMAPYTEPLVYVTAQGRLHGVITDVELLAKSSKPK